MRPGAAGRLLAPLVFFAGLFAAAGAAEAQIVSKSKQGAGSLADELPILIGQGFEFTNDNEAKEYALPMTLEWNFVEDAKLVVETGYTWIKSKVPSVQSAAGWTDLETFIEWEFLPERRYRPALTLEVGAKWPTAKHPSIGTGKTDVTLGLIFSKEIDLWSFDFGIVYTFAGSPKGVKIRDTLEVSFAAQWEFHPHFEFEAELLYSHGGGAAFSGQAGGIGGLGASSRIIGGGGSEFELSLGLAWKISDYFKVEVGAVLQPDGSWQAVAFWELDFGGGK